MWMFTKYGFFSIVLDSRNHKQVAIRARAVKDLEALQAAFPDMLEKREIELTPKRDYYCRLTLPKEHYAGLALALAGALDYDDFKSELKRTHVQDDKLPILNQLWADMNDYQHQQHPGMGLYNQGKPKPKGGPRKRQPDPDIDYSDSYSFGTRRLF